MKQFDLVFEKTLRYIAEQEYIDSTFQDNVLALVKTLKDSDYLPANKDTEAQTKEILSQPNNVKEILLSTQEQNLPAIKLQVKQESDSESFSVTVINLEKPTEQKEFGNSMMETIFSDIIQYIKTIALQKISPSSAIDELPPTQGAQAQPGAEQSALPK